MARRDKGARSTATTATKSDQTAYDDTGYLDRDSRSWTDQPEHGHHESVEHRHDRDHHEGDVHRHEEHGGLKAGAVFFGWLVAVAMTILLAGVIGAIATAVGSSLSLTPSQAQQEAGTVGAATAVTLVIVLMIAYFTGGYVAGRLARFDGGRQGLGVWLLGLLVTALVAGIGAIFGSEYNIFDRVNLPAIPVPTNTLAIGGVIAAVVLILATVLVAVFGGKAGQRYHTKIDRTPV